MKKFLLFLIGLMISVWTMGQSTANYTFSYAFNGSLEDISSGATVLLTGNNDDNAGPVTNIGFTFYFMGTAYTQFSANSNGQIRLGSTQISGSSTSYTASTAILGPMSGDNEINNGMTCKVIGSAPNRILVIEWNQFYVYYTNITGAGNMQALLYESTGQIQYIYGEIYNSSSSSQSRSIFISASNTANKSGSVTVAATPTYESSATSPTSNSFAASVLIANLASTAQGSRTVYSFTPGYSTTPANPITMTFTSISQSGMTVNWVDNSTTETFFTIYRSDDGGINYSVAGTVASTTTAGTGTGYSLAMTGLMPGVTYYYKVQAGNEASAPSGFLTGSQSTSAAGNIVSIASGNWNATTTWNTSTVPTASDNVTIADGHTVTINATATCNALTVGQGTSGILRFDATTARTLTVINGVTVAAGGTFAAGVSGGSSLAHTLNIGGSTNLGAGIGSLTVNGIFNMYYGSSRPRASVYFYGIGSATISGTGTTCNFYQFYLNKGTTTASLTVMPPVLEIQRAFTVQDGNTVGLVNTHTAGTLKFGGTFTLTTPLSSSASYSMPAFGALWLNNPNFTFTAQNGSHTINGLLRISDGIYNVGTASGNSVGLASNSSVMIEGGTLNIAGRFAVSSASNITNFNISGGTINLATIQNSSTTYYSFDAGTSASSNFTMSGGAIIIKTGTSTYGSAYRGPSTSATVNISGGTLQIGSASTSASTNYRMLGCAPTTVLDGTINPNLNLYGNTRIYGDFTFNGTGIFNLSTSAYNFDMRGMNATYPGNIVNNGTFTLNGSTSPSMTFSSSFGDQTFTNNGTITGNQVPGLTINNTFGGGGTVYFPSGLTILGNTSLTLTKGTLNVGTGITLGTGAATGFTYTITDGTVVGTQTLAFGSGTIAYTYNGTAVQNTGAELPAAITGALTINNALGVTLNSPLSAGSLTLTSGKLTTSGTNLLTITGSTIASITGGSSTAYINGPLERTIPASLAAGSTFNFPVGKSTYNPLALVDPLTYATGTVVIRAEAFDANCGGTAGSGLSALNTDRYWRTAITSGSANYTSSNVRISDPSATIAANKAIGQCATVNGSYTSLGGTTVADGTVTAVNPSYTLNYFVLGNKAPMVYVSSEVEQPIIDLVEQGSVNQPIIRIKVVTSGADPVIAATSFSLTTNGSTVGNNNTDIANAKLFYTGASATFTPTSQFGTTVTDFNSGSGAFTITGTQNLLDGTNYFWLTYDIQPGAINNHVVDATCPSVTVLIPRTPTVINPYGNRTIFTPVSTGIMFEPFEGTWTIPSTLTTTPPGGAWSSGSTAASNEWHRNDFTDGWTYPTSGSPAASGANGTTYYSRFHSYGISSGTGDLITPAMNFSTVSGNKYCEFYYINPTGSDVVNVYLSTDGGSTWGSSLLSVGTAATWTKYTAALGSSNATSVKIKFTATSDYGDDDIGVDEVRVYASTNPNMKYMSSTTYQVTTDPILIGNTDEPIIAVQVVTLYPNNPMTLTSLALDTKGSTNPLADLSTAKVYYTGSSTSFSTATLFGTHSNPEGSYNVTGSQELLEGNNYFWVTYDTKPTAINGDYADAECPTMTINGSDFNTTIWAPTGRRVLKNALSGTYTIDNTLPTAGTNYNNFSDAFLDLNALGIVGPVTFNVAAGETFPVTCVQYSASTSYALALITSGTPTFPIIFQKSGIGTNPEISITGTSYTTDIGIFLYGTDYITFNGINITDAGTSATNWLERAIYLQGPADDNCNHVTIKNCTIDLSAANTSSKGIHLSANAPTLPANANCYNTFLNNTIQDSHNGYYFTGNSTNHDIGNRIGTESSGTSSILNLGSGLSTTLYAIYNTNQDDLTIENTTINGINNGTTVYGIYCSSSAGTLTIQGNTLTNVNSTNAFYGIYPSSPTGTTIVQSNTISNCVATSTFYAIYPNGPTGPVTIQSNNLTNLTGNSTLYGIYPNFSSSTAYPAATLTIQDNILNTLNNSGGTSACYGIYPYYPSGPVIVQNNTVTGLTTASSAIGIYPYYVWGPSATIQGNTVSNMTTTGSAANYGIYYYPQSTVATSIINGNTITGLSSPNTGAYSIAGLYFYANANNAVSVANNIINNLISGTTSTSYYVYGIYYAPTSTAVTTISGNVINGLVCPGKGAYGLYVTNGLSNNIFNNKIYNIANTYTGASTTFADGIYISGGSTNNVYNNFIYNIKAPGATGTPSTAGIYLGGGTSDNIAYNTIYLDYTSTAAANTSAALYITIGPTMVDLKNNIFVNNANMSTGTLAAAFYKSSTSIANLSFTTNNNLFYAGVPGAKNVIFFDGTTAKQTLAEYKTLMTPRESNSVTENPPFISATSPYDLHLSTTTQTQAESGGLTVSSPVPIVADYDGHPRYPNPGYPDNILSPAKAPDIGADEFGGLLMDITPPVITYNPLMNTASVANRTLVATITDLSGVPTSGIGLPVLYWKINSGTYNTVTGSYLGSNQYQFVFGAGVVLNDVVSYFVVAQDLAAVPNVAAFPAAGAGGLAANPPACATPPTEPTTYTIIRTFLSGTYKIGGTGTTPSPGCQYVDITAAFADLTSREITGGAVTFLLTATYNSAEENAFPVVLNPVAGASSVNNIKIKPDVGVSPVITGSSTGAILKLNGIDYLTIDGSNAGTSSRNMTISNSNTGTSSAVIWVANGSATDGANNNVIKNCLISGNGATTTLVGIYSAGNATISTIVGPVIANSNNLYQNNQIVSVQYGIYLFGPGSSLDQGSQVTGNTIGLATSGNELGFEGIDLYNQSGATIAGNEIQNVIASSNTVAGINVRETKNSTISANKVHDMGYTGTGTSNVFGITTSSSSFITAVDPTANTYVNNIVYGLTSTGASTSWNVSGINNNGGYGDKYYFNTVALTGSLGGASGTGGSACFSNGNGATATCADALNIRNNVFYMNATAVAAAKLYAHYNKLPILTGNTLNNNDLFVVATAPATANLGYLNATNIANLAAWQTATGQEANSVSSEPYFISNVDLTPTNAALNGTGVTIAGITTDYNGTTRSAPPDMGAIEFTPYTCYPPTGLTISGISGGDATVSWTAANPAPANGYEIFYSTSPTPPSPSQTPSGTVGAGILTYNMTGLASLTTYYVWVRSNCGAATSVWSVRTSFLSGCGIIAAFPWTENFDAMTTIGTGILPGCWNSYMVGGTGTNSWRTQNEGSQSYNDPRSLPNYVVCYYSPYSGYTKYLFTPGFALTAGISYDFSYYWVGDNHSGWTADLLYNTSQSETGATVLTNFISSSTTTSSSYTYQSQNFIPPTTGNYYFIIRVVNTVSPYYLGFDDFRLEVTPTCITPTGLIASSIQQTGATLHWTASVPPPQNGYEWEVRTSGAPGSGPAGLVTSGATAAGVLTVTTTGLTPSTLYYAYVRAHCIGSDYSYWTSATTFTTLCSNASLPVAEGFNTSGTAVFPACWSSQFVTGTSALSFQTSSSNPTTTPQEGTRFVFWNSFNSGWPAGNKTRLVSPPITTTGIPSVDVNFYWFNEYNTTYNSGVYLLEGVQVQYSLDGTNWIDAGPFVPRTDSTLASGTGAWKLKNITLPGAAGNVSTVYIGFLFVSQYGDNCSLDNVVINATPTDPLLSVSPASSSCGYAPVYGYTSEKTYNLSGVRLTGAPGNIVVTAPANFQVSLTSGSGFTGSVNVAYSTATLASTPIYVRGNPTTTNVAYSGNVTHVGGGASVNEAVTCNSYIYSPYCISAAENNSDEEIFNVTLGTLNNSSICGSIGDVGSVAYRYSNYTISVSPPMLYPGIAYPFSVSVNTCGTTNYESATAVFIDYNHNNDFTDPGEKVYLTPAATLGPHLVAGSFTIPADASLGITMMRVVNMETDDPSTVLPCGTYGYGETEDYVINILPQQMLYVSSTTVNNTANVLPGTIDQMVVGLQLVTSGAVSPLALTAITANASGTTSIGDIANARVYYTGTSPVFNTAAQFGSTIAVPTLTDFTITGSQTLQNGTNYFWMTYDIAPAAADGHHIAGLIPGIMIGADAKVPTPGAPGFRTVVIPLSGTVTVGTGGTYPTLTCTGGLFEAINNRGLSGDLTANIISNISTEDGTHALNQWSEAGAGNYILKIQPASASLKTISGSYNGGLFRLYGADRVTFTGIYSDDENQYLAFVNNNTSATSAVFWLGSTPQSGAVDNTIKSCIISGNSGTTTLYGIVSSSGTTMGGTPELANNNNTFLSNDIIRCQYGIAIYGANGNDQGLSISTNTLGSTVEAEKLGLNGIFLTGQQNATISDNIISGVVSTLNTAVYGIRLTGAASTILFTRNKISDIKNTNPGGYSAIGIALGSSSSAAGVTVSNNLIFDITGYGFNSLTTDNGYGINISSGGGYNLWFNSVNLATNQSSTTGKPACLIIGSSSTIPAGGLDIRNNIFSIPATAGAERYAIISNAASSKFASINYNDYYTSGSNLGYIGSANRANLAAWQTGTGQDAASVSADPAFVSPVNLHTVVPALNNGGVTIAAVPADFDMIARTNPPDIGAYEFTLPITAINTLAATNVNQTTVDLHGDISTNGEKVNVFFEYGLNTGYGSTTDAVPASIRSFVLTPFDKSLEGLLPSTTYHYRAKGVSTTSGEVIYGQDMTFMTLDLPTIQGPNSVCEGAVENVYVTETGKYDYTWTVLGGTITAGGTPTDNTVTVTWPTAGTQTVTLNYRSTPAGPFAPTATVYPVVVNPNLPVSVTIVASDNPVCTGAPVTFTATPVNGGPNPAYQWKVNGTDAGVNSPTYTYVPLNGDVITCVLTSDEPCPMGNPATSNEITMTVTPPYLPVSVTIVPSANDVCLGSPVTFTATPVNGGLTPIYEWKVNGVTVGTNSPTYTYVPVNNDAVICILTTSDYCGTGSPATSNTVVMTVNDPLPVSVTIVVDNNPWCEGSLVTFTATPVNGGTVPTYQWKVNGSNTGTNSPVLGYFPVNGDVFTCVMTSSLSCISGSPATSNAITMNITPLQLPSVTIVESANDVCDQTFITFMATPVFGGQNPSYQWKVNGVNAGVNSPTYTYAPANGDLVTCVMTSDYPCPTVNPVTSNTITMITRPRNPVSITIFESANYICEGSLITYTAIPVNEGTAPSYQWKVNGQNAGTDSPYFDFSPVNNDVITCVLTSNIDCPSGNPATSNPVVMTVYPNMPVSVSIVASANPVCFGDQVTFTATPVNGGQTPHYQWKVNNVNAGTNTPTFTYTPANNDVVKCILTSSENCTQENPVTSNTIKITVNSPLPVSVSIVASENPVCEGTQVTFTATPVNGGVTPAYQWKVNGVNAGSDSPVFTYTPSDGDQIIVNCQSSIVNCVSGNPATSNTITMSVTAALPVSVTIVASANPVCEGTPVTFTATPVNGGATPSYQWKVNGVNAGTNTPTYTFVPVNGDQVTCVLTSSLTCVTGNPATSNTIDMNVTPLLPVSVSIVASANQVCAGTLVTFTATPVNGGTTPAYQWKVNGVAVGTNTPTYTYVPVDGDLVTCELTSSLTCVTGNPATSNTIVMSVTAVLPVSVSIVASANPVCEGTPVTFTATPVNGGVTPSYQWKVNGVNAGTDNAVYTYTPANGDLVSCVLTSSLPCVSGNPATSNVITMTVDPKLPVSVSIVASANPVCIGTLVTFTATPVNGGPLPSYHWTVNGNTIDVDAPIYTYMPANGDQVVCVLTSSLTCVSGNPATSNTILMIVNPLPVPVITGPATVVAGTTGVVYTTTPGQVNYLWTISTGGLITSGGTPADNTVTVTWNTEGAQWIAVNYTDALTGCTGAQPAVYPVTVTPAPFIVVTSPDGGENWKQGSVHPITWNDNIDGNVKIELYKGGVFHSGIIASTPSTGSWSWTIPAGMETGTDYKVKISSVADPSVNDFSNADFTISSSIPVNLEVQNVVIVSGQVVCYDALQTITVAGGSTIFVVENGGSATFIAGQNIVYLPGTKVEEGGYMLGKITTTNQFCGSVIIPAMVSTGTEDPTPALESTLFRLYPNPTRSAFTLEQSGTRIYDVLKVEIYNMMGERILTNEIIGQKKHEFLLSSMPVGVYFVRISGGDQVETIKLIKQ